MNAQWKVEFRAVDKLGETYRTVWLSSPDLRDAKEARKRAVFAADVRLRRKLAKLYGAAHMQATKLHVVNVTCVG